MSDADLKAKWAQITDPVEALQEMITHGYFIGTDPYYRDLNDALWEMAERAVEHAEKQHATAQGLPNSP